MSDISMVSIMFEEMKQILKRIETNLAKPVQQNNEPKFDELAHLKNQLQETEQEILSKIEEFQQAPLPPQKVQHRIAIELASSWVFFTILGLSVAMLISLFIHYRQQEANKYLRDNDLKYRYVKAFNYADSTSIYILEDIFEYNRDSEKIKEIRKATIQYEEDMKATARRLEQAKLKEEEAIKLNEEATQLKSK